MKKFWQSVFVALAVLAIHLAPATAQTTVNSTTTAAAVVANTRQVTLTAVTSIAVNDWIFMDWEAMQVNAIDTTNKVVTVTRGTQGTAARAHASGVVVWTGPARRFYQDEVIGGATCTATAQGFLPHIVIRSGSVSDCVDSEWVTYRKEGRRVANLGRSDGVTTYTTAGAIAIRPGVVLIGSGGALAMTIGNPTIEQNGIVMVIIASTAQAHTVTYTAGFDGGTTARDVATYGGAIGDSMTIVAVNGVWYRLGIGVGAFSGVTLG